jgi:putative PIN family toxin of toxin-antitoxin system
MNIVLDANVIVSAFFWGGNPRLVLERVISGLDKLFVSKEILAEIEEVLARPKFHASKESIVYFMSSLEEVSNKIIPDRHMKNVSRDASDDKYIECGIAAHVDYIISGDIHLLELKEYENIKIITAKEYLERIQF